MLSKFDPYGAFIDLGGIDGLLHYRYVMETPQHPSDVLNVGEEILVKVLSYDKRKPRGHLALNLAVTHGMILSRHTQLAQDYLVEQQTLRIIALSKLKRALKDSSHV